MCKEPTIRFSATRERYYDEPQGKFDNYPVIYVNWSMAQTYCEWAGRRLPTEAEWEKAARGTDGRIYPWGNDPPNHDLVNYDGYFGDTLNVGRYPKGASPYGAVDMAGNVDEWVADWYSATYYQSSPASNPTGPDSGEDKVLRGGDWFLNDYVSSAVPPPCCYTRLDHPARPTRCPRSQRQRRFSLRSWHLHVAPLFSGLHHGTLVLPGGVPGILAQLGINMAM